MASSDPGLGPRGDAEVDVPDRFRSPFELRARTVAVVPPAALGIAFGSVIVSAVQAVGVDGVTWWQLLLALASLPTLPLFAAFPIPEALVIGLAAGTSLPVWAWGGAAQARRLEPSFGPDWARWARRYALFPLAALFMALVFIGGLTPMAG